MISLNIHCYYNYIRNTIVIFKLAQQGFNSKMHQTSIAAKIRTFSVIEFTNFFVAERQQQ